MNDLAYAGWDQFPHTMTDYIKDFPVWLKTFSVLSLEFSNSADNIFTFPITKVSVRTIFSVNYNIFFARLYKSILVCSISGYLCSVLQNQTSDFPSWANTLHMSSPSLAGPGWLGHTTDMTGGSIRLSFWETNYIFQSIASIQLHQIKMKNVYIKHNKYEISNSTVTGNHSPLPAQCPKVFTALNFKSIQHNTQQIVRDLRRKLPTIDICHPKTVFETRWHWLILDWVCLWADRHS